MRNGLLCTYIVARYRPAGNFLGEFKENVKRGRFVTSRCVIYARRKNKIFHAPQPSPSPALSKRSGIPRFRTKTRRSLNETIEDDDDVEVESGSGENESDGKTTKTRRSVNETIDGLNDDDNQGTGSGENDYEINDEEAVFRERRGVNKKNHHRHRHHHHHHHHHHHRHNHHKRHHHNNHYHQQEKFPSRNQRERNISVLPVISYFTNVSTVPIAPLTDRRNGVPDSVITFISS